MEEKLRPITIIFLKPLKIAHFFENKKNPGQKQPLKSVSMPDNFPKTIKNRSFFRK
jgi:hypothetical protein